MRNIHLLAIGDVDRLLLEDLSDALADAFRFGPGVAGRLGCRILPASLAPDFALHPTRMQVHSTEILGRLPNFVQPDTWRLLGVTEMDLYIPILTFVFGEAQVGNTCAVVSTHRLRQEFYGLPADEGLLIDRLLKEAVHELGHTLRLPHCEDYRCAMAASHAVEWIDLKGSKLCGDCRSRVIGFT
jgi:archaemetzincin